MKPQKLRVIFHVPKWPPRPACHLRFSYGSAACPAFGKQRFRYILGLKDIPLSFPCMLLKQFSWVGDIVKVEALHDHKGKYSGIVIILILILIILIFWCMTRPDAVKRSRFPGISWQVMHVSHFLVTRHASYLTYRYSFAINRSILLLLLHCFTWAFQAEYASAMFCWQNKQSIILNSILVIPVPPNAQSELHDVMYMRKISMKSMYE